ncbi:hypothetical protein KBC75_02345 [Candidatus Shapirobacteria bacterium]|nr:hypothetical protein [Candidatus Shapirobacteria bacterium]
MSDWLDRQTGKMTKEEIKDWAFVSFSTIALIIILAVEPDWIKIAIPVASLALIFAMVSVLVFRDESNQVLLLEFLTLFGTMVLILFMETVSAFCLISISVLSVAIVLHLGMMLAKKRWNGDYYKQMLLRQIMKESGLPLTSDGMHPDVTAMFQRVRNEVKKSQ